MTDTDTFSDELKQAFRTFIDKQGIPVKFIGIDYSGEPLTDFYDWSDYAGKRHVNPRYDGCKWEVPEGSLLYEESYDQFQGTFYEGDTSEDEFTDVTLRWTGTLAELINRLAPKDESKKSWTL